ncbi:peptidoglycan recognition protein family protein, partial [Gilliamella sp. Fer1-1]|uniref:peptidoglycan recognition protein family protein n=1 Tax=Gilliamella sp. Fer1-1 TaxID=3120240 RepID=UPI000B2B7F1A
GAKRVSCWDWFDFMQIKETATLKELYLDADKSLKRNKDNHSLSQYKPTIKETLSILDKQYHVETKIYTSIKEASFKGIADKPMLFTALSRLLINYESEWYSEIDAEGKMPKWEALNSELTENAKNVLTYLKEADEAKCDIYVNTLAADEQKSVKKGLEELRRSIARFPADYIDSPTEKLSKGQLDIYFLLKQLEKQVTAWEKTKEKIKKMLWWDDVAKGLAKLNQPKDTPPENGETTNTTTTPTDSAPPATLSADGRAWFIHPVQIMSLINKKTYINNEGFICSDSITQYQVKKLERGNIIGPNAIVLHRTFSKGSAINVIENTWKSPWNKDNIGAHFVIDKDGTIYQVVSLKKYANHVGKIRPRCALTGNCDSTYKSKTLREQYLSELKKDYPERYPYNQDSIGIEVVAWWDDKTKLWDDATPQQLESIRNLVIFLQKEFNLNDKDLYQHQCIAYKTSGEGKNLYPPADNWNIDPRHY